MRADTCVVPRQLPSHVFSPQQPSLCNSSIVSVTAFPLSSACLRGRRSALCPHVQAPFCTAIRQLPATPSPAAHPLASSCPCPVTWVRSQKQQQAGMQMLPGWRGEAAGQFTQVLVG